MENNAMLQKLRTTISTKICADGTTRGAIALLGKRDFPTAEAWELYAACLCKAISAMENFPKAETSAEAAEAVENAVKYISGAFDVLKKSLAVSGGMPENLQRAAIKAKHVRGWALCGAFARMKVNYSSAERSIDMKAYKPLQKFVEMDISDILNKRERLSVVNASKVNCNFENAIAARAKAKAEKEKAEAAEAKAKAEAEAKAKAASPEAAAIKAEAAEVKAAEKAEAAEAKAKAEAADVKTGLAVNHATFGRGAIVDVADGRALIDFGEKVGKKLFGLDAFGKYLEAVKPEAEAEAKPAEAKPEAEAKPKRKPASRKGASRKAKPEAKPEAEAEAKPEAEAK